MNCTNTRPLATSLHQNLSQGHQDKEISAGAVMICASAFGADYVRQHGQASLIERISTAGAQGIEIREELLTEQDYPLAELGEAIRHAKLECAYSAAHPLFDSHGQPDLEHIDQTLARAAELGAQLVKFGLGHLNPTNIETGARTLLTHLDDNALPITIENDQTSCGGDPLIHAALHRALRKDASLNCSISATLDLGNGHWTSHDLSLAASRLGQYVGYVHCKAVCHDRGKLIVCAPDDATLEHWSRLWQHLPPSVPRAIEFPLDPEDAKSQALQVARLHTLPLALTS